MSSLIRQLLPALVPLFVYIFIVIPTLRRVLRRQYYRFGNQIFWICIVFFFNIFGALAYFIIEQDNE